MYCNAKHIKTIILNVTSTVLTRFSFIWPSDLYFFYLIWPLYQHGLDIIKTTFWQSFNLLKVKMWPLELMMMNLWRCLPSRSAIMPFGEQLSFISIFNLISISRQTIFLEDYSYIYCVSIIGSGDGRYKNIVIWLFLNIYKLQTKSAIVFDMINR